MGTQSSDRDYWNKMEKQVAGLKDQLGRLNTQHIELIGKYERLTKVVDVSGELTYWHEKADTLKSERDKAVEELADYSNSLKHAMEGHKDEQHCACFPYLRAEVQSLRTRLASAEVCLEVLLDSMGALANPSEIDPDALGISPNEAQTIKQWIATHLAGSAQDGEQGEPAFERAGVEDWVSVDSRLGEGNCYPAGEQGEPVRPRNLMTGQETSEGVTTGRVDMTQPAEPGGDHE